MSKKLSPTTKLLNFINVWARYRERKECTKDGFQTDYGRGYHQACSDIFEKTSDLDLVKDWEKEMGYE